jgi:hypothetical protein
MKDAIIGNNIYDLPIEVIEEIVDDTFKEMRKY